MSNQSTLSITEMQNAAALASEQLTEAQIGLSEKIGALKATAFIKKLVTVTEIKMLSELKETKQYKGFRLFDDEGKLVTVTTWEDFCKSLGHSREKIDQDILNLATFGEDFLQASQRMGLGYRDLRKLRKLPEESQAIIINAEAVKAEDKESLIDMIEEMSAKHNTQTNEMKVRIHKLEQDGEAKDRVIADKSKKMDELYEELVKQQNNPPKPADVARELSAQLSTIEIAARSEISKLQEIFDGFMAHKAAHGTDHTAKMVGVLNQLILDCEVLRGRYTLPTATPTDEAPEWLLADDTPADVL